MCEVDRDKKRAGEGRFCQKLFADVYPNSPAAAADEYLGTLRSLMLPSGGIGISALSSIFIRVFVPTSIPPRTASLAPLASPAA